MAVVAPPAPRRPRPGSPERPVNARMYRGMWLARRPASARRVQRLPAVGAAGRVPSRVRRRVGVDARNRARPLPSRAPPGTPGADAAAQWFREQLTPYGLNVRTRTSRRTCRVAARWSSRTSSPRFAAGPTGGSSSWRTATTSGSTGRRRQRLGHGGADRARPLLRHAGRARGRTVRAAHTIDFVSTDGGALGAVGARHYAETQGDRVDAVINLDTIGVPARRPADRRRPAALDVADARPHRSRALDQTGSLPRRPSSLRQLIDLAFPYTLFGQGPFVGRGIPAITLTAGGDVPPAPSRTSPPAASRPSASARSDVRRRPCSGRSTRASRPGAAARRSSTSAPASSGLGNSARPRRRAAAVPRGRCRPVRPLPAPPDRTRTGDSELSQPTVLLVVRRADVRVLAWLGAWPKGRHDPDSADERDRRSLAARCARRHRRPLRDRLARRPRPTDPAPPCHSRGGARRSHCGAPRPGVISLLVVATNGFALIFLLPSVHAWLWLLQVRDWPFWVRLPVMAGRPRAAPLVLGGPPGPRRRRAGLRCGQLVALGYVPLPLLALSIAGRRGRSGGRTHGRRYAPYPSREERRRFGPLRRLVRAVLLVVVRRRETRAERQALGA